METSKILVARRANLGFVKVVGRGSFQNSGCLKSFYQQLLNDKAQKANRFIIDLGECTYLDSTFLGILLGLGLKLRAAGNGLLDILNASPRNIELLKNLGLDRLINITSKPAEEVNGTATASLEELNCAIPTKKEAGPTILEAHEALMEFDPRNVPKFKDVVEFLREDLGQHAASSA